MTPLFALSVLGPILPPEEIKKTFMPVVANLASDRVANVRMNVAKAIIQSAAVLKQKPELVVSIFFLHFKQMAN